MAARAWPIECHRRRVALARVVLLGGLSFFLAAPAMAVPADPIAAGLQAHASGVFLNAGGDVLTARHAVAGCHDLFVLKDGQVVRARLEAQSETLDLAVVSTALKPYLSATLPGADDVSSTSQAVFVESYNVLQRMPNRASTVFNAMVVPAEGALSLLSSAQPGASGSPVLGAAGLLLGVVVERVAIDGKPSSKLMLSRARAAGASSGTRVKAIAAHQIKEFLHAHEIEFSESDVPQLGPMQPQAPRAATLSVGIICG